ncbi:MAG: GNAT family N-acetyltransferase [Candidatus Thorarchaeota archaeon]|nr:MAG: GNAT family N-acetyltransferase [Candidatus Thorarchaeota archaeon]
MATIVREYQSIDEEEVVRLVAQFRQFLGELRSQEVRLDLDSAREELRYYLKRRYPIFVAVEDGLLIGYLVCRIDEDVVWAESLYVVPSKRRRGVASALYEKAEHLVEEFGGDTVYNWVHPNNEAIIRFLLARGYNVLNLIELRRARKNEKPGKIVVGEHEFLY